MGGRLGRRAFREGHPLCTPRPKDHHHWVRRFIWSLSPRSPNMDTQSNKNISLQAEESPPDPPALEERSGKQKAWKKYGRRPSLAFWIKFTVIVAVFLAVVTILKSICVIAVSIMAAVATKTFSQVLSEKIAVFIVICVTAAVALSACIYAMIAVLTKNNRPMKYTGIVLVSLAVIQLVIAASTLIVKEDDRAVIGNELGDSFRLALEHNPRHTKKWAKTQRILKCCGMAGADDYRVLNLPPYYAPDVPISCCPSYDPERSPLLQEREREVCKAQRVYYKVGCQHLVEETLFGASALELKVLAPYIVLEVLVTVAMFVVAKLRQKQKNNDISFQDEEANKK